MREGAQSTVLLGMLAVLGISIIRDVQSGKAFTSDALPRRIFGVLIAILMLSWLARIAPRMAQGLTWLAIVAVLVANPESLDVFRVSGGTNRTPTGDPGLPPRRQKG